MRGDHVDQVLSAGDGLWQRRGREFGRLAERRDGFERHGSDRTRRRRLRRIVPLVVHDVGDPAAEIVPPVGMKIG